MADMTCQVAREALLTAELDQLRGSDASELAEHLEGCAACRQRADVLLEGYASLEAGMSQLVPMQPTARVRSNTRRRPNFVWLPVPLAAAAAIALLLGRESPQPPPNVDTLARLMRLATPPVVTPANKQAVVIEKMDMTIVWLYEQEQL